MSSITLSVTIDSDRRLVIDLPPDTPIGQAEVVITPAQNQISQRPDRPMTREEARDILSKASMLSVHTAPKDFVPLSPEALLQNGNLPSDARPSHELIDEDRGDH